MGKNVGVWFLAGFAIAITMAAEVSTPNAIVIFLAGTITRYVVGLGVKWLFGNKWAEAHPVQAQFWRHAHLFARGLHLEKDPRDCRHCNAN